MGAAVSLFGGSSSSYDDTAIQAEVDLNTAKVDGSDRVLKAGDTMTGNLTIDSDGARVIADNPAAGSPLTGYMMLQDGVTRGFLYHHEGTGQLALKRYEADGTTIDCELVLQPGSISATGSLTISASNALVNLNNTDAAARNVGVQLRHDAVLRGYLYFDKVANILALRRYDTDGTTIDGQILFFANSVITQSGGMSIFAASPSSTGPRITVFGDAANSGEILLREAPDNGNAGVKIKSAASMLVDYSLTLPADAPAAGDSLSQSATGEMEWVQNVYGRHFQYTDAVLAELWPAVSNGVAYRLNAVTPEAGDYFISASGSVNAAGTGTNLGLRICIDGVHQHPVSPYIQNSILEAPFLLNQVGSFAAGDDPLIEMSITHDYTGVASFEDVVLQFYRVA